GTLSNSNSDCANISDLSFKEAEVQIFQDTDPLLINDVFVGSFRRDIVFQPGEPITNEELAVLRAHALAQLFDNVYGRNSLNAPVLTTTSGRAVCESGDEFRSAQITIRVERFGL
ncbi:MAG: hypothetical protein AAFQ73_15775, partial [Pseudomonadota bacterium]